MRTENLRGKYQLRCVIKTNGDAEQGEDNNEIINRSTAEYASMIGRNPHRSQGYLERIFVGYAKRNLRRQGNAKIKAKGDRVQLAAHKKTGLPQARGPVCFVRPPTTVH